SLPDEAPEKSLSRSQQPFLVVRSRVASLVVSVPCISRQSVPFLPATFVPATPSAHDAPTSHNPCRNNSGTQLRHDNRKQTPEVEQPESGERDRQTEAVVPVGDPLASPQYQERGNRGQTRKEIAALKLDETQIVP